MKPKSKKTSEKQWIGINDESNSSFDLNSLKDAIDNASEKSLLVPKTKKNAFDLTSMSIAISSVDRQCSKWRLSAMKRQQLFKSKAERERESVKQRLLTLVLISDKYSCKS